MQRGLQEQYALAREMVGEIENDERIAAEAAGQPELASQQE